jgi:hypothetical protein
MNLVAIAIACVVFITGAFVNKKEIATVVEVPVVETSEVLSHEDEIEPTEEVTSTPSVTPVVIDTPTPTPTKNSNKTTINNSVNISVKNGKRVAIMNGKEVELDENGCYDYENEGTKIHACAN